jgi:hypothetical protein
MRGRVWAAGLALGCTAVAGCVTEEKTGTGSNFRFETWIPTAIVLGGTVLLAVAVLLFRAGYFRFGLAGTLFGLVCVVTGPTMFFDEAVIDDDHFALRIGLWFAPIVHAVRFDDVTAFQEIVEEATDNRGRKSTTRYFVFTTKTGIQKVPLGDLMKHGPAAKVREVVRQRSIPPT